MRCPRSGYSIDMLVHAGSVAEGSKFSRGTDEGRDMCGDWHDAKRWAVEFDGPSHFLACDGSPTGATLIKRRHLELLGYSLVSVPYWEWDRLAGSQRHEYLRGKLGEAVGYHGGLHVS